MKTLKLFLVIVVITAMGEILAAQTTAVSSGNQKTETFKVWGKCEMCKARIEKTVKEDGATGANWNVTTNILTVTFDPSKTSVDSFSKKLALAGHDTEKYKATDAAYQKLPGCCHYERSK